MIKQHLQSFAELFYPRLCFACGELSPPKSRQICLPCEANLPETGFHLDDTNELLMKFQGRIKLERAVALYFFKKNSRVQHLVHALKYGGKPEVGVQLGQMYGAILRDSNVFGDIDGIIPVPLHPDKKKKRGYNQSSKFAEGLSKSLQKEWHDEVLLRAVFTETQTKKSVIERFDNVESVFEVRSPERFSGRHLLLVDDVITTGATTEACVLALQKAIPNLRVSVAAIAIATS